MSESEKKAENQKPSFKKHGVFDKKNKRHAQFNGHRQSTTDPKRRAVQQHEAHKARMGKTVAICSVALLAILFSFRGYEQWDRQNKKEKFVESLITKVSELTKLSEESTGYAKHEYALQAILKLTTAMRILPARTVEFRKSINQFREGISQGVILKEKNYIEPTALIDLKHIPQGNFGMGRKPYELGKHDELPQRKVTISYDFWMAKTETTNFQLRQHFPKHRLEPWKKYKIDTDSQPAVKLDWNTSMIFCEMLNVAARKANKLPEGYEYRLPTEAEWEYACRAGTETPYYWGNDFSVTGASFANSLDKKSSKILDWGTSRNAAPYDKYIVAAPVASFEPNAFGLYDMNGNVWEWCWDWYNPNAYKELPSVNPVQTQPIETKVQKRKPYDSGYYYVSTTSKVQRGGSWGNLPKDHRSANRNFIEPTHKNDTGTGFRVVLAPKISELTKK